MTKSLSISFQYNYKQSVPDISSISTTERIIRSRIANLVLQLEAFYFAYIVRHQESVDFSVNIDLQLFHI